MTRLHEVLGARRSVRKFTNEVPSDELLTKVIEGAITAPSASNKQPWRFFIVEDRDIIAAMAKAVRAAVERIAEHVPAESEEAFRTYGDYFTRFEAAPVVIVPIHRGHNVLSHLVDDDLDATLRAQIDAMEESSGLVGTSLALMNLLLTAHDLDLGASAMTGPLVAAAELKSILSVPESWGIVALVPVGFPDEAPRATARKPVDKVVRWIK